MLRIRPGFFKRSGEREKKHTNSISENVRKHCRGDHDDDESFAAPELQKDGRLVAGTEEPCKHDRSHFFFVTS